MRIFNTAKSRPRSSGGGNGGGGELSYLGQTSWARPSPATPDEAYALGWRLVPFNTKTGLTNAVTAMQGHDYIYYSGPGTLPTSTDFANGTFYSGSGSLLISSSSSDPFQLIGKNPASTVVLDFGCSHNIYEPSRITPNYVRFAYTGSARFEAFNYEGNSNVNIYGGEYDSGIGGNGFRIWANSHDFVIDGIYVAKAGVSGVAVHSVTGSGAAGVVTDFTIRAEVTRWCMNPAFDAHTEDPGSGAHAATLHGNYGEMSHGTIAMYAYNPLQPGEYSAGQTWPGGGGCSVIEPGMNAGGNQDYMTYYAKGENMHFIPGANPYTPPQIVGTGGCLFAIWGHTKLNGNVVG